MSSTPIQFGCPSPQPSTPNFSAATIQRWELPIVRRPVYPIEFWNINERALRALAKTNNALESTHYHFMVYFKNFLTYNFKKKLNHHPSMSDFILKFLKDVTKQVDIARSAINFQHIRKRKYVIKEAQIMTTLNEAEYDDDVQLLNTLTLLGLQMNGYVEGLRITRNQPEGRDSEYGVDTTESQYTSHEQPSTSSFVY